MSIRAKTKKRLLILLACTVVLGAGLATLTAYGLAQANQRLEDDRAAGFAAYDKAIEAQERIDEIEERMYATWGNLQNVKARLRETGLSTGEAADLEKRRQTLEADMAKQRAERAKAEEDRVFGDALNSLYRYTRRRPDDAEALYRLARSREEVPMDRFQHIQVAIGWYNRVRDIDFGHEGAQERLLSLYRRSGQSSEGVTLAEEILRRDPKHFEALKTMAASKLNLREFQAAKKSAMEAATLKPEDLEVQMYVLRAMYHMDESREKIVEQAADELKKDPDSPKLKMLMGFAYVLGKDRDKATEMLKAAATNDPPDEEFVTMLSRLFDMIGMFGESFALLESGVQKFGTQDLENAYVRRLYEMGRFDDILDRLDRDHLSEDLLGIKAMSLVQKGRQKELPAIIAKLDERSKSNSTARAWAYVLNTLTHGKNVSPQEAIEAYRGAVQADPSNPYIRDLLARIYMQTRETELSLEQWENASKLAPTWAAPFLGMAQVYSLTNRPEQAMVASQAALKRSPQNAVAIVGFVNSMRDMIVEGKAVKQAEATEKLLEMLGQIQERQPGEPNTLSAYVEILAHTGAKDKAKAALASALSDPTQNQRFNERKLLDLAKISERYELGLESDARALIEGRVGVTPGLAMVRAMEMVKADRAGAIKYMRSQVDAAPKDNVEWQAQWAQFLEQIGDDERAADAWRALGNRYPENPSVQRLVMRSSSLIDDRAFLETTIERIKSISGEQGMTWKLARARWLLTGAPTGRQAQEAKDLLEPIVQASSENIEAQLLLAMAYGALDNTVGAIERLEAVRKLAPENQMIALRLAQLRLATGAQEEARRVLDAVASSKDATPQELRQAAAMYAQLGDIERAKTLLAANADDQAGDMLRAQIYLRENKLQEAADEYRKLMESSPSVMVISAYANLLRGTGQGDEAIKVLAHLKTLNLADGVEALVRAEHYERAGQTERALEYYTEASKAERTRQIAYRKLVEINLLEGNVDAALAANDAARKAVSGDPVFTLVNSHKELLRRSAGRPQMKPILRAVVADSGNGDVAVEVLRTIDKALEEKRTAGDTLTELNRIADRYPRFLELQHLVTDWYLMLGRYLEASRLAGRTMQAFPNDDGAAERATKAEMQQERWSDALSAARAWRARSPGAGLRPDMAIAQAQLGAKKPAEAIKQLEPYLVYAQKNQPAYAEWWYLYGWALIDAKRHEEAARYLKPLIDEAPGWRQVWQRLATVEMEDTTLAETWMERLEAVTPDDAVDEHLRLADGWIALAQKHDEERFHERGMALLAGLYKAHADEPGVALPYAIHLQQAGNIAEAEAVYKHVLSVDSGNPFALNNLAMLYVEEKRNLDEALSLARKVVEARPNVASFLDTEAQVHMARADYDRAIAALTRAVELDQEGTEWRINLAKAHLAKGDTAAAREQVRQIDRRRDPRVPIPAKLQLQLDELTRQIADKEKQARTN